MYCIFARESIKLMNGNRGKLGTQAGHAYLHAFWDAARRFPDDCPAYQDETHARKITLVVDTVEELKALQAAYKDVCGVSLVTDAGFTVFDQPTTTCLGIGPIADDNIGEDLKALKVLI
jgi:peptidyl-tRNA hydrolase